MAQKPTTYAKNAEQLARAFGFNLSSRKRKAALATVAGWINDKTFPKKSAKGWVVGEVREWQTKQMELKAVDKPAGDGELFLSDEMKVDAYRKKLQKHLRIHLGLEPGTLKKYQIEELEANNLIPDMPSGKSGKVPEAFPAGAGTGEENDLCDTLNDIATRMAAHYSNADGSSKVRYLIDGKAISDWKEGRRLNNKPGPPGKCNSRQWSAKQWIEWFDKHFWLEWKKAEPGTGQAEAFGDADLREMQRLEEFKKLEDNQRERDIRDGKYKSVEVVNRNVVVLGATLNRHLTDHAEKGLVDGVLAGFTTQISDPKWGMTRENAEGLYQVLAELVRNGARMATDALRDGLAKTLREIKVSDQPEAQG